VDWRRWSGSGSGGENAEESSPWALGWPALLLLPRGDFGRRDACVREDWRQKGGKDRDQTGVGGSLALGFVCLIRRLLLIQKSGQFEKEREYYRDVLFVNRLRPGIVFNLPIAWLLSLSFMLSWLVLHLVRRFYFVVFNTDMLISSNETSSI
jgi:hypothetical protein